MGLRKIAEYPISVAAAGTTNQNLDAYDLSRVRAVVSELIITAAATDATDTLSVKFQETSDGVQFNTRIQHTLQVGNSAASATTPESERITLYTGAQGLDAADEIVEPTGSKSAAALGAPGVRHGPLVGRRRGGTSYYGGAVATHRIQLVAVQTNALAFTGILILWIDSPDC
jgi:hypothetical protein